jgi:hypothetical protein
VWSGASEFCQLNGLSPEPCTGTLISQDAGWYDVAKPDGGTPRSYEILIADFVPALKAKGFTAADIHLLLVTNPAAALTVRPRLSGAAPAR